MPERRRCGFPGWSSGACSDLSSRGELATGTLPTQRAARSVSGYTRLFINLGTKDGFYKASFLQFILDESNLKKEVLGKIDMRDMNSWVEIDQASAGTMIKAIDGKRYNNRTDKRARYRPKNPDKKPLGDPNVKKLSTEQRRKLQHLLQNAMA